MRNGSWQRDRMMIIMKIASQCCGSGEYLVETTARNVSGSGLVGPRSASYYLATMLLRRMLEVPDTLVDNLVMICLVLPAYSNHIETEMDTVAPRGSAHVELQVCVHVMGYVCLCIDDPRVITPLASSQVGIRPARCMLHWQVLLYSAQSRHRSEVRAALRGWSSGHQCDLVCSTSIADILLYAEDRTRTSPPHDGGVRRYASRPQPQLLSIYGTPTVSNHWLHTVDGTEWHDLYCDNFPAPFRALFSSLIL